MSCEVLGAGEGPAGLGPAGVVDADGAILGALAAGPMAVRVSTVPISSAYLQAARWSVLGLGGAEDVPVRAVTAELAWGLWLLELDAPLRAGELYEVQIEGGCAIFRAALAYPAAGVAPFDLANPAELGSLQLNDRGDLAVESRVAGLRKRVLRRLSTFRGGFFHLPEYGVAQPIKGLTRPGVLAAVAAEARAQVMREPEVLRAQVRVEQPDPFVVVISVRALARGGLDVEAALSVDLRAG